MNRSSAAFFVVIVLLACETSTSNTDAVSHLGYTVLDVVESDGETKEVGSTDTAENPDSTVSDCSWAIASWLLTDCTGTTYGFELVKTPQSCVYQVVSTNALFSGAIATVQESAIEIKLNNLNQCHGVFTNQAIIGSCGTSTGPCAIEAAQNQ